MRLEISPTPMPFLIDALVILAYFAIIIGIGLSQRSKSDSVEGFTLGDRQIAWWAVLASILAAEISAATFLGAPESGYSRQNWSYAQFAIGTVLARIIVSFLFIPIFYRHNVISLYEFLETRFGPTTRSFASITFMVTRRAGDGHAAVCFGDHHGDCGGHVAGRRGGCEYEVLAVCGGRRGGHAADGALHVGRRHPRR